MDAISSDSAAKPAGFSLKAMVKALRPHQWVKNSFVVAPLVFAKAYGDPAAVKRVGMAFAAFCCIASAVYLLNDMRDREADRLHPTKRFRPLASGALSVPAAKVLLAGLSVCSMALGYLASGPMLVALLAAYAVLNVFYSLGLKRIAYVDALCIALGFELRVAVGGVAAEVPVSVYLWSVTLCLSLYLAFGKRLHELRQSGAKAKQRAALTGYAQAVLKQLSWLLGVLTVLAYTAYTLDHERAALLGSTRMYLTAPLVAFGLWRFRQLVLSGASESPTEMMLRDLPFLVNALAWCVAATLILAGIV